METISIPGVGAEQEQMNRNNIDFCSTGNNTPRLAQPIGLDIPPRRFHPKYLEYQTQRPLEISVTMIPNPCIAY